MEDAGLYDLVIIGGNAGGLSVAISAKRSGIDSIRVVEPGDTVAFPELVPENQLDVGYGEVVESIDREPGESSTDSTSRDIVVRTSSHSYRARGCLLAHRLSPDPEWSAPIPIPESDRVHVDALPEQLTDQDVLVIGYTDNAVELVVAAANRGAHVVMAAGGMDPAMLSPAGEHMLRRLERERRATILYRAVPNQIGVVEGLPMAFFDDRRTPDLQFDHVVFSTTRHQPQALRDVITTAANESGRVICLVDPDDYSGGPAAHGWDVGKVVADAVFPELEIVPERSPLDRRSDHAGAVDELRAEHYNATITVFEPTHSDLWVLRVRPDDGNTSHVAGQYASLGLGFWEKRIDDAVDDDLEQRWTKLIRRSYSISHPIFDSNDYLASHRENDELEFYIVLVPPTPENTPALTPRLAHKRPGDRIYLGPKVAGRYTLNAVTDPTCAVLFLSTGTGEAPHNAMIAELLRKGHSGPIVSAVTVRRWADLGYLEKHRRLEERFANYHYVPMPTREADVPKRYLQDLLRDGDLDEIVGGDLDPTSAHAFLCGNPAMIGLPEEVDGHEVFPETTGVVELLVAHGFSLDRRGSPGNVHYEEYW